MRLVYIDREGGGDCWGGVGGVDVMDQAMPLALFPASVALDGDFRVVGRD